MINCLILAGGGRSALTARENVSNKALIKVGEKEMVAHVTETLSKVIKRRHIVIVGPTDDLRPLKQRLGVKVIPENGSIVGNVASGVRFFGTGRPILVCSSDIPLVTEEAVNDFLDRCEPYDFDLYCPIVSKKDTERMFPESDRTYVKLKEGTFTAGNVFLMNPLKMDVFADIGDRVLEARKNPLKVASLFGVSTVLRLIGGRLTLNQAVGILEDSGIRARPIVSSYPEIGFDVDKVEDLEAVRSFYRKGGE